MSDQILQNDEFIKACKNASIKALGGVVSEGDLQNFLNRMPKSGLESAGKDSITDQKQAQANLFQVAIWGGVKCTPDNLPYVFEAHHWGIGFAEMTSVGFMYNAYDGPDSWKYFFEKTAGYHAQGVADFGGILQINWFTKGGLPIGQFNSAAAGCGIFEVGGEGYWKKK